MKNDYHYGFSFDHKLKNHTFWSRQIRVLIDLQSRVQIPLLLVALRPSMSWHMHLELWGRYNSYKHWINSYRLRLSFHILQNHCHSWDKLAIDHRQPELRIQVRIQIQIQIRIRVHCKKIHRMQVHYKLVHCILALVLIFLAYLLAL